MQKRAALLCGVAIFFAVFFSLKTKPQTLVSPMAKSPAPTPTVTPSPTPTIEPTPTPTIKPSPTPTSTPTPTPVIIAPVDLEQLFVKYSSEYSINKDLLVKIAKCESNFNPNAVYQNYAGLYQFTESLWIQTRQLMGQSTDTNLRFNAEESIRTAAFMISQNHLSIWPACSK